ncbi:hypothetical protein [Corynebacterium freneyi]|uniref:Tail assembly chaperone n=1 Tax=Corynebacterium freneyi TaxID=134034 RepID=A0ABS4U8Q8_9CORY|nr:hypothetical protein [Corynebacterium freneyi]MBP2333043.1 hypothetical protein [Corynebacterium freneyi]QXA52860.1 hypothetical protein I6L56_12775 [Corynebacterium freneyi]WJZ04855.1 hypothetical protein CFREN_04385 [Corynebacterium freneyi]
MTINLLDSLAVAGGDSVEVTVGDHTLSVRRDFTGDEVAAIIGLHSEGGIKPTLDEQLRALAAALSDSDDETQSAFVDALMDMPVLVIQQVTLRLAQIAGLRGEDGSFTVGARP